MKTWFGVGQGGMVRSSMVSLSLLRGYGDGQEGRAGLEGKVRYGHQGGGQEHTGQLRIIYNNNNDNKMR